MKTRNIIIIFLLGILATVTVMFFVTRDRQKAEYENLVHQRQQDILTKQILIDSLHTLINQVQENMVIVEQKRLTAERNLTNLKKQYEEERSRVIGLSNDEQLRLLTDNLSRICSN